MNRRLLIAAALATLPRLCFAYTPFVPNDPYFFPHPTGNTSWSQWYLDKTGTSAGVDVNIKPAWDRGFTGAGQVVGVLDKGFEYTHPDLLPNFNPAFSWDFRDNDPDPITIGNNHGTNCASLVAARGGDGIGMTGVAPRASFAGIRVQVGYTFDNTTAISLDAQSIAYRPADIPVKSYSAMEIKSFAPVEYPAAAQLDDAARSYANSGGIFVTGPGNYRVTPAGGHPYYYDGDGNRKSLAHLPDIVNVAALNAYGSYASYAGYGSSATVCAPGGEWPGTTMLLADPVGSAGVNPGTSGYEDFPDQNYTAFGSGDSYAIPLVAGGLAVAREAHASTFGDNPSGINNVRYYKHLLAASSRVVDPNDNSPVGRWTTNAAGFHFNNNYGFGVLDVGALSAAAQRSSSVSARITASSGKISVGQVLESYNSVGISVTCMITETTPLEDIVLTLNLNESNPAAFDAYYAEMGIWVQSPGGTKSVLSFPRPDSDLIRRNYQAVSLNWDYTSNAFWGENPYGTWTINVSTPYWGIYEWSSFELTTHSGRLLTPTPGDANLDNVVDALDFNALASHYGESTFLWASGDFDADGKVTTTDFNLLAGNFGVSSALLGANVPEPAICLSLLAIPLLLRRRA